MSDETRVLTIGFTKTTAENFFERLQRSGAKTVIDVRLNNTSQLSGFAKSDDLKYFLRETSGISYRHIPLLAPEPSMLSSYRKGEMPWNEYENQFLALMRHRGIEKRLSPAMLEDACLLCSEDTPRHCHRRLVCEYLNEQWSGRLKVQHL